MIGIVSGDSWQHDTPLDIGFLSCLGDDLSRNERTTAGGWGILQHSRKLLGSRTRQAFSAYCQEHQVGTWPH